MRARTSRQSDGWGVVFCGRLADRQVELSLIRNWASIAIVRYDQDTPISIHKLVLADWASGQLVGVVRSQVLENVRTNVLSC
jgi:hypothetical protein